MTTDKINELFTAALESEIKVLELKEITKDHVYNWRKGRKIATIGDKLNLLWQLGKIKITANEPN